MPDHSEALSESLSTLSHYFVGDMTLREALDKVATLACQTVPGADMAGITMVVDGRAKTAIFTDEKSPEIDASQYETGIGPCLDAFRHKEVFRIDDTEKDDRWAPFSEAAAARGIRSTVSFPLVANGEGVGALNLYSRSEAAFSEQDEKLGLTFAAQAGIALANTQAYWDAYELSQNLSEAMKSRATIEQAKGILMAARRCDADEAFQILVRASQRENRKLREVAEQLVSGTSARGKQSADR